MSEEAKKTAAGTAGTEVKKTRKAKYLHHPLELVCWARCHTVEQGLNWLQDRGFISDLCVTVKDVAPVDVERVVRLFRERWSVKGGVS